MSHRPKNWTKALFAGLLAVCASLVLASPALANDVEAGSLTFSSDSSLAGSDPTAVTVTAGGAVTVGTSAKSTATIDVTQGVLAAGAQEVTSITLASGFNGVINFNNIKLVHGESNSTGVKIVLQGTGQGAQVNFTGCTLSGNQTDFSGGGSTFAYSTIDVDDNATNNEINFLGGNIITGGSSIGTKAVDNEAEARGGNALLFHATPNTTNNVTFSGSNTLIGGFHNVNVAATKVSAHNAIRVSNGLTASEITSDKQPTGTGKVNINFASGTTTLNGGLNESRAAVDIVKAQVNVVVDGVVNATGATVTVTDAEANPGNDTTPGHGSSAFNVHGGTTTITGSGVMNLTGNGAGVGLRVGGECIIGTEDGQGPTVNAASENGIPNKAGDVYVRPGIYVEKIDSTKGDKNAGSGVLTINSGTVSAQGAKPAAEPASSTNNTATYVGGPGILVADNEQAGGHATDAYPILTINGGTVSATGGQSVPKTADGASAYQGGAGISVESDALCSINGGTITATGGAGSVAGTGNTPPAGNQGIGLAATTNLTIANGTAVAGSGPEITAVGAPAVSSSTNAFTPTMNTGKSSTDATFYPWLIQASNATAGTSPYLVGFATAAGTQKPSVSITQSTSTTAGTPQWVNIAPHVLTGLSVGVDTNGAGYVVPETVNPRLPQEAKNQYALVATPTFAGVDNLNTSGVPFTNVTLSNSSITPAANVVWINQQQGTFYVSADAQGNMLTASGTAALQAGSPLLRLYPDLATTGQGEVEVPVVYTVTLTMGKTSADASQGSYVVYATPADNVPARSANGDVVYYTAADGSGNLVAQLGKSAPVLTSLPTAGNTASSTTPVVVNITDPTGASFIGYFDETGESPVQVPVSTVTFDTTTTLTAEGGTATLASIQPSPVELAQGSAVNTMATITVEPTNEDITSYAFSEGSADVAWTVTYTMPDGSAASGQSNGVTVASTENVTTGENPFTVKSYVTLQANGTATIGSFRATPKHAGGTLATKGALNGYAVVQVVEGSGGPQTGTTVYRLYNPDNGAHLITADLNEWRTLSSGVGGWEDEGIAFIAAESGVPVYRLLNPNNGDHLYTTSANEYDTLEGDGWVKEGTAFYGATSSPYPIYRLWNRYQTASEGLGSHLWTADHNEYVELNRIDPNGWKQEGEAWFAAALEPGENA